MKKIAILSLALTVCLCIASGAFHWLTPTDVYGATCATTKELKILLKNKSTTLSSPLTAEKPPWTLKKRQIINRLCFHHGRGWKSLGASVPIGKPGKASKRKQNRFLLNVPKRLPMVFGCVTYGKMSINAPMSEKPKAA